jgi:fatty acid desaturase
MDLPRQTRTLEWPTLGLFAITYILYGVLTVYAALLPSFFVVFLLAITIALHSSLQHEALHMLEPRWPVFGYLIAAPALGLAIPYDRFRDLHLAHHVNEVLTDPYDDPETNYLTVETWTALSPITQIILRFNNTFLGRILVGPLVGQVYFFASEIGAIRAGDMDARHGWLRFIPAVICVIFWLFYCTTISATSYLIACYLGLSILKVRTYIEHRAHEIAQGRSVIVEDRGPLAFLFLNNNFHAVHHAHPNIPWYNLPAAFRAHRARFLVQNNDYYFKNYWAVMRMYLCAEKDSVAHPIWNLQNRQKPPTNSSNNQRQKT